MENAEVPNVRSLKLVTTVSGLTQQRIELGLGGQLELFVKL